MRLLRAVVPAAWGFVFLWAGCTSRTHEPVPLPGGEPRAGSESVRADLFARAADDPDAMAPVARGVAIAPHLPEASAGRYEVLPPHPQTLRPRILIDARAGTPEVQRAVEELRDVRRASGVPLARAPRLVGAVPMRLERVDAQDRDTQLVTLFKAGAQQRVERGDVVRIGSSRGAALEVEVLGVTRPDEAAAQHVQVRVSRADRLEAADPSGQRGYPADPQSRDGEAWLRAHAPEVELLAEFDAAAGDDPTPFVVFDPEPLPLAPGQPSPSNQNVSPLAAAILRFNAPLDLASARPLDTVFFATRDLLDPAEQQRFIAQQGLDPAAFREEKYRTPHLVHARVFDAGRGAVLRLEPPFGFYLDDVMRRADEGVPFAQKRFRYFLHLVGGTEGLRGADGAPVDLGARFVVVPFSLDTRSDASGLPLFADNYVFSVARRFASADEDERPSYYLASETQAPGAPFNPDAYPLEDLFGAVIVDGLLHPRPTSRARAVVDDRNQPPVPPQGTPEQHCPTTALGEAQIATPTAAVPFGIGLVNPLNPLGARLQTTWREIDMGLSRTDPFDFDLDVEAMFWGAATGVPIVPDTFERVSLFLGHGEHRPEPCVGTHSALPTFPGSGLERVFAANYAANHDLSGAPVPGPAPHAAFLDQTLAIDPASAVLDPTGTHRYLPLPAFERPYFTWRDQRVAVQGGKTGVGSDLVPRGPSSFPSYILSPFLAGQGKFVISSSGQPEFQLGAWNNQDERSFAAPATSENITGGSIGAIGLPLLVDFWTHPSASATGANGWQVSLAVQSSAAPEFRAYSAGGVVGGQPMPVDPTTPEWLVASGGPSPSGARTLPGDNTVFWVMCDFLKSQTVATAGFVDLVDPHRVPASNGDPRLGRFPRAPGQTLGFAHELGGPTGIGFPAGTQATVEFRGAGAVDPAPWRAIAAGYATVPDPSNFPLDPRKAGDAHIVKFDDRPGPGGPRNAWTYFYNKNVTDYVDDPNRLADPAFTAQFAGPSEQFTPDDVRYVSWRIVLRNSDDGTVTPTPDSFAMSYRFGN
jgi:hypothetical protein